MLVNTFIHIPGIGSVSEKKIWESNVFSWENSKDFSSIKLSNAKITDILTHAEKSTIQLKGRNPNYFEKSLPSHQHYRLFPEFRDSCAYIDIETTGLSTSSQITTIAVYDGKEIKVYVQGKNLDSFVNDIQKYNVLITYNGRTFDIPFIESYFNIKLSHAQIDLRYILAHLGFKGGLKKCEKKLGLDRKELDGVDGYFAVLLWYEYKRRGNKKALETLLAYNIEDVINLETLMIKTYNLNIKDTPFSESHKIKIPPKPKNSLKADLKTIELLKHRN